MEAGAGRGEIARGTLPQLSEIDEMLRFGVHVPNFGPFGDAAALIELARAAEDASWDGLFLWDHIRWEGDRWPVLDPWIGLAAVAVATESMKLGTLVTPLSRRRPWKVARETASLDRLSGGRVIFGAGLGWASDIEFGAFGEIVDDRRRASTLDEALEVLAGLWSGLPFSFAGEHFSLTDVTFTPAPIQQPRIPIWIAGLWPHRRPFRRAARWDGAFPELVGGGTLTPADVADIASYVCQHRSGESAVYDIAIGGYSEAEEASGDRFAAYEAAGLTWWLERLDPSRSPSLAAALDRIMAGPPRPEAAV